MDSAAGAHRVIKPEAYRTAFRLIRQAPRRTPRASFKRFATVEVVCVHHREPPGQDISCGEQGVGGSPGPAAPWGHRVTGWEVVETLGNGQDFKVVPISLQEVLVEDLGPYPGERRTPLAGTPPDGRQTPNSP